MLFQRKQAHVMTWEIVVAFKIIICLSNITNNNLIVFIYMGNRNSFNSSRKVYVISNQDDDKNIEGYKHG